MHKGLQRQIFCLFLAIQCTSSAGSFSAGYEFGEMALNEFKHFAGELSYTLENRHAVRISMFNVALTERHLSSNEASAVDGENVEGLWRGVDLYYDYPITNTLFISPSIGYHRNKYTHTILGSSVTHSTGTVGFAASYLGNGVFGVDDLYWRFSFTFNHSFNKQEKTNLGESVIQGGSFSFIPLIFIGYKFQ